MEFTRRTEGLLKFLDDHKLYPDRMVIDGASSGPELKIGGRKKVIFCSSNYLGLANDPRVIEKMAQALHVFGHGSCGSRLISGTTSAHIELEERIASYKKVESAMIFSAGMFVNLGVIPAVFNIPDVELGSVVKTKIRNLFFRQTPGAIFSDQLNHASIIDGARLAGVKKYIFPHRDYKSLEKNLANSKAATKLIVSDGVFSMDGDEADLAELVRLKNQYGALLMLDDAHATGVLGKNGMGTHEKQGIGIDQIDLYMGTLSKAFGGVGGFLAGKKSLIDYMRISARTYIFNGSIPAVSAVGVKAAIDIAEKESWRRERVIELAQKFQKEISDLGFQTVGSTTQIIPVIIGDEQKALGVSRRLYDKGFLSPAIRWPATEKGKARIRIAFMSTHSDDQVEALLETFRELRNDPGAN